MPILPEVSAAALALMRDGWMVGGSTSDWEAEDRISDGATSQNSSGLLDPLGDVQAAHGSLSDRSRFSTGSIEGGRSSTGSGTSRSSTGSGISLQSTESGSSSSASTTSSASTLRFKPLGLSGAARRSGRLAAHHIPLKLPASRVAYQHIIGLLTWVVVPALHTHLLLT